MTPNLRIAHVTATFPPYRGGTGNVCRQHAAALAARGHQVRVVTAAMTGAPACEEQAGVMIRRLRPWLQVGNAPLLPGLLGALRGVDVIHLHYPFFGGELTTLAAIRTGAPLVITYHQDVLLPGVRGGVAWLLRQTVGRWTLRHAARVLFTSHDYGEASYARRLLGGRAARIDALPNGVDAQHFTPGQPDPALRPQLQLGPADQVVLLVAGLDHAHAFKGVAVLLAAIAQLPPTVHAVLVGDGDLRPSYQSAADVLGIAGRVHFAGRVSDAALTDYYRLADVAVLPSTSMGEAFGLVLLESLACGTPVVASRLPGVRTVVDHERTGLLVPPGDAAALAVALAALLADPARRAAMGAAGQVAVTERYTWPHIAAQLETIYHTVLDDARRA